MKLNNMHKNVEAWQWTDYEKDTFYRIRAEEGRDHHLGWSCNVCVGQLRFFMYVHKWPTTKVPQVLTLGLQLNFSRWIHIYGICEYSNLW